MRNFTVAISQSKLGFLTHFRQLPEDVHVEYASPKAAVESLNEAVLYRPPGLDEVQSNAVAFCPLGYSLDYTSPQRKKGPESSQPLHHFESKEASSRLTRARKPLTA